MINQLQGMSNISMIALKREGVPTSMRRETMQTEQAKGCSLNSYRSQMVGGRADD